MLNSKVQDALKEFFTPEFLNRIDDIIVFNKLSKDDSLKIAKLMLDDFKNEVKKKKINISYTNKVVKFIVKNGFNDKFGARPLKRTITKNIEDILSLKYIKDEISPDKEYIFDVIDDHVVINEK
ncbi:MAG: hypothetical protein PHD20_05630 [Clostridia bacterium]|nr:hypothetical protein [Clostridia bacterium]